MCRPCFSSKGWLGHLSGQSGFTLIELITTLALVGFMALGVAYLVVPQVQGYLFARENAEVTQKAEMALTRLGREFAECFDCNGANGTIALPYSFSNMLGNRTIARTDDRVTLDGVTLVNQVEGFDLQREQEPSENNATFINLTLQLMNRQGGGVQTFRTRIYCRNIYK